MEGSKFEWMLTVVKFDCFESCSQICRLEMVLVGCVAETIFKLIDSTRCFQMVYVNIFVGFFLYRKNGYSKVVIIV